MRKVLIATCMLASLTLPLFIMGCGSSSSSTPVATVEPDTTAPTVESCSPEADATDVSVDAMITVKLSEALDPSTIDNATLTFSVDGFPFEKVNKVRSTKTATVTYDAATNTIICAPTFDFAANTLYTATLTATVKDLAGNVLETELVWSFTTGPDTVAPRVAETTPANGGYASPSSSGFISVLYTENGVTATNTSFTLTCDGSDVLLEESFFFFEGAFIEAPLTLGQSCTASFSATLTDQIGNAGDVSETWSFMVDYPLITGAPVVSGSHIAGSSFDFIVPVNPATGCVQVGILDGLTSIGYGSGCVENVGDPQITVQGATMQVTTGDYLIQLLAIDGADYIGSFYELVDNVSTVNYTTYTTDQLTVPADSGIPLTTITLIAVPDLTISITSIVDQTTSLLLSYEVCNDSLADADAFDVGVFQNPASEPQMGDTPDGVDSLATLVTGACSTGSFTLPMSPGPITNFYVIADVNEAVVESYEGNNLAGEAWRHPDETHISTDIPLDIVDLSETLSTQTVTSSITSLSEIAVTLDIIHTWDSDLTITLVSPSGTTIDLSSDNGGSGDDYQMTTFDDFADTVITAGSAPFNGSYRPEQPLSTFAGENPNGTWTLQVYDDIGGDEGTLNSWSINIW